MIPQTDLSWQEDSWQSALQNAITDPAELCRLLNLDTADLDLSEIAAKEFGLKVPRSFVARMERGNAQDPLLRQVLNLADEMVDADGYLKDPLEETKFNPLPGLIHKYKNRVLLTVSGACAIHCRYCFRRHFSYEDNNPGSDGWLPVLRYLQEHDEINEIIYSGGDPLNAPDRLLRRLTAQLKNIPNLKRLRVHTRFPVVIPERITDDCLEWLSIFPNSVVVLHINHANELDSNVEKAVDKLKSAGISLFNQAVLLKGVNDSIEAQLDLHQQSFDLGIQPYYLHLLDPVKGAAHFDTDEKFSLELYEQMRANLAGYLLPSLAREIPSDIAKKRL